MEVIVLFEGYSIQEGESQLANCTCTLIKGLPNIVVDTMTAWDGPNLVEALKRHDLNCEDIDYVICTHGHSDHIGCNYLFHRATHIVGFSVSHKNKYFDHDFQSGDEFVITDKIRVIPTPGHTMQDVSVIVESSRGIIAITGDLFEREEDLIDDTVWKNAGSNNENLQYINRAKILELADFIIPGHGPMFKIQKNVK